MHFNQSFPSIDPKELRQGRVHDQWKLNLWHTSIQYVLKHTLETFNRL